MKRRKRVLPPYVIEDVAKATGQVRLYYRPPRGPDGAGQPIRKIRIWPSVEQEGFWPAYEAAKRGEQLPKPDKERKKRTVAGGTFRMLCEDYFRSAAFYQLAEKTQSARRGTLLSCCADETKVGSGLFMGDVPLAEFGTRHISALRDRKAELPEAANNRVKAIRGLFSWHQEGQDGARNPCAGFKKLKPKNADGFHTWSLEEVEQYERRHPIGTTARLAMDLALYTTQRKSDVARLGPSAVTVENGIPWLLIRRQRKTNARVEMPIIEPLAESIAARPMKDGPTFLMTSYGKSYTANGLGNAFRAWCDEAGLPHCTMHGLRKATSSRLAELGVDELGIGTVTGHAEGSREVSRYTRAARRRPIAAAAMKKLEESLMAKSRTAPEEAVAETQKVPFQKEDA